MVRTNSRLHAGARLLLPLLIAVIALLAIASAAVAAPSAPAGFGAANYQDFVPLTIPSDYTACGVQYYAQSPSLLSPSTTYYVKPAFCQGGYNAATARGAIWNATSSQWVRTDAAWDQFPTFSTNVSGNLAATWAYVTFGDDTQSGDWTLYFIARPVSGTDAEAKLGDKTSAIKVLDMKTTGAWIHNGVSIYTSATPVRTEINASTSADRVTANTLAVYQTEVTGPTDGAADIIPADALTGGFRLWMPIPNPGYGATPSGSDIQVRIQRTALASVSPRNPLYTNVSAFAEPPADTELAVGLTTSADQTPPTAPSSLTALGGATSITLSWPAATDNVAVTSYRVYRWYDAAGGATWSPKHEYVGSVAPSADGSGAYTDTSASLVMGTTYRYEVRAEDAATNIGPRTATASAIFGDQPPVTTATGLVADKTSGWTNSTAPTFGLSASDADGSGVASTWYTVNGGAKVLWTGNPVVPAGIVQGSNTITYWSVDTGDLAETPKTGYLNVDWTAPVTSVAGVPSGWVTRPVTLRFTAETRADGSPLAYTEYKVDGGDWTRGTSVTVRADGVTRVAYRSANTAGNVEAEKTCTVRIDGITPKVSAAGRVRAWRGGLARFSFRVSDPAVKSVDVRIGITMYGGQVKIVGGGAKKVGKRVVVSVRCTLPVATYSWRAVAIDAAGNRGVSSWRFLQVLPGKHNRR